MADLPFYLQLRGMVAIVLLSVMVGAGVVLVSRPDGTPEQRARVWLAGREADLRCRGSYCDVLPPHPASPFTLDCSASRCALATP